MKVGGYLFFPGAPAAGLTGAATNDDAGLATFFACLGFFFSRLLRCWPLAMGFLLRGCGPDHNPAAPRM